MIHRIILILFSCSLLSLDKLSLESVQYYYQKADSAKKQIQIFHPLFIRQSAAIFNEWNIKTPILFHVVLSENASAFGKLTGKNWDTASVFDATTDRFYFQNIQSLQKQKILHKTIRHELCHQMIFVKRKQLTDFWLEEGFCEVVAGIVKSVKGLKLLQTIRTEQELKQFVVRNSKSNSKSNKNQAYQVSAMYVNYLLQKLGKQALLEMIVAGELRGDYYSGFYKEITSR